MDIRIYEYVIDVYVEGGWVWAARGVMCGYDDGVAMWFGLRDHNFSSVARVVASGQGERLLYQNSEMDVIVSRV